MRKQIYLMLQCSCEMKGRNGRFSLTRISLINRPMTGALKSLKLDLRRRKLSDEGENQQKIQPT